MEDGPILLFLEELAFRRGEGVEKATVEGGCGIDQAGAMQLAQMSAEPLPPGLYVVATPIGNLGDLSPRAADVLRQASLILVEDTRVSGKLLRHIGAQTRMRSYHDHTSKAERDAILKELG